MEVRFPEVAISRDGQRAVLVMEHDGEWYRIANRAAYGTLFDVRVRPRLRPLAWEVMYSDDFRAIWDVPTQTLGWREPFKGVVQELAMAAIGEYLDEAPQPDVPPDGQRLPTIKLLTYFFPVFQRPAEQDDARLLRYIGGKIFWGHRLGAESVGLYRYDAIRFGVGESDLHQVAWQAEGTLWQRDASGSYRPLPRLLTDFRAGALPGLERPLVEQVETFLDRSRYPAAAYHMDKAIGFLRGTPVDQANAAKEAVNAVESMARTLLSDNAATLGDCVKHFRRKGILPREMCRVLESLYVYRSATPGVGHGSSVVPSVPLEDAEFVLGVASVAIKYLGTLGPRVSSAGDS